MSPRRVMRRGFLARLGAVSSVLGLTAACSNSTPAASTSARAATTQPATTAGSNPSTPAVAASSPSAVAAAPTTAAPPAGGPSTRVTFTYGAGMAFAPLYVAADKGYFRDEGLDVNLQLVGAGQDVLALTAAGQFDGTVVGLGVNFFNALARGFDIKYVAALAVSPSDPNARQPTALVVRQPLLDSGEIKTITDLKGRTIGMPGGAGGAGSYQLHTLLAPAHLTLKDVNLANLDMPTLLIALTNGSVDAGIPGEPFLTQLELDKRAAPFGGPFGLDFATSGVLYGGGFIQSKRPAAEAFMRGCVRGSRDMQGDKLLSPENVAIYAKYTSLPAETIRQIGQFAYSPNLTSHADRDLLSIQQVFMDEGLAAYTTPLTIQQMLDTSFVDVAVQRLGPYTPGP